MNGKIEEKVLKILSQVSTEEKVRNRLLNFKTKRVLIALEHLKLAAKKLKTAD